MEDDEYTYTILGKYKDILLIIYQMAPICTKQHKDIENYFFHVRVLATGELNKKGYKIT